MSSFEQRINKISKIIQTETDGEYALQPLANSFVRLSYKGTSVLDFCVSGKTERRVYDDVNTLVQSTVFIMVRLAAYKAKRGNYETFAQPIIYL